MGAARTAPAAIPPHGQRAHGWPQWNCKARDRVEAQHHSHRLPQVLVDRGGHVLVHG